MFSISPRVSVLQFLLGGKGANLAEMSAIGLAVPPGFTITTEVCSAFHKHGRVLPSGVWEAAVAKLHAVENDMGRKLGDPTAPLLLSVRSGAAISMPGMMDTVTPPHIVTCTLFSNDLSPPWPLTSLASHLLGLSPPWPLTSRAGVEPGPQRCDGRGHGAVLRRALRHGLVPPLPAHVRHRRHGHPAPPLRGRHAPPQGAGGERERVSPSLPPATRPHPYSLPPHPHTRTPAHPHTRTPAHPYTHTPIHPYTHTPVQVGAAQDSDLTGAHLRALTATYKDIYRQNNKVGPLPPPTPLLPPPTPLLPPPDPTAPL